MDEDTAKYLSETAEAQAAMLSVPTDPLLAWDELMSRALDSVPVTKVASVDSYFRNNHVVARDGDVIAHATNDAVLARLDGYLIVPLEEVPDVEAFLSTLKRTPERVCNATGSSKPVVASISGLTTEHSADHRMGAWR